MMFNLHCQTIMIRRQYNLIVRIFSNLMLALNLILNKLISDVDFRITQAWYVITEETLANIGKNLLLILQSCVLFPVKLVTKGTTSELPLINVGNSEVFDRNFHFLIVSNRNYHCFLAAHRHLLVANFSCYANLTIRALYCDKP